MIDREILLAEITKAFSGVKRPRICTANLTLDDKRTEKTFHGLLAQDIDDLALIGAYDGEDLCQFTPEALHYYFPCYLRYLAKQRPYWEFPLLLNFITFLEYSTDQQKWAGGSPLTHEQARVVTLTFSPEQKRCTVEVLSLILENRQKYGLNDDDEVAEDRLPRWMLRDARTLIKDFNLRDYGNYKARIENIIPRLSSN